MLDGSENGKKFSIVIMYLDSVSVSFLEKKPIGLHLLPSICSSAAPMAFVDASVVKTRGVSGNG